MSDTETTGDNGRTAKGTFAKGNPGRPKGSRNKLSTEFFDALYADFKEHGADVIAAARTTDPGSYVRIIASLMPKNIEADVAHTITGVRWLTEQEWLASLTDQGGSSDHSTKADGDTQSLSPTDEPVRH